MNGTHFIPGKRIYTYKSEPFFTIKRTDLNRLEQTLGHLPRITTQQGWDIVVQSIDLIGRAKRYLYN